MLVVTEPMVITTVMVRLMKLIIISGGLKQLTESRNMITGGLMVIVMVKLP